MSTIELSGITKRYGGNAAVDGVDGVDLSLSDGTLTVLVGPSGCGKSPRCASSPAWRPRTMARCVSADVTSPVPLRASATWPWSFRTMRCTRT